MDLHPQPHPLDLKRARVAGQHLLAANDPLSHDDRALAAMFDGPLEGEVGHSPSYLNDLMVHHARLALACHAAGNTVGFKHHREIARAVADQVHVCPECQTQYFQPQECDWCPGQQAIPASNPATH